MQHDAGLRAATRVIYEAVYPAEDGFDEAECLRTLHYRRAVDVALRVADCGVSDANRQLALLRCGPLQRRSADRGQHLRGSRLAPRHQGHLQRLPA